MAGMFVEGPAMVAIYRLMMGLNPINTYCAPILLYVGRACPSLS